MALILFLAGINYFGVKIGGEVQIIVTVIKVLLIAFIVVAGLGFRKSARPRASHAAHTLDNCGFFRGAGGRIMGL